VTASGRVRDCCTTAPVYAAGATGAAAAGQALAAVGTRSMSSVVVRRNSRR
jgi:hypothetical protein